MRTATFASTDVLVLDATRRVQELRRSIRQQLRQQHALMLSGTLRKEGYHGGELRALEVAHDMLMEVHATQRRIVKTRLTAVLHALESEYKRMELLAGGLHGPWFLGFSNVWRRVIRVVESLPVTENPNSSQTENSGSRAEN